MIVLIVDGKFNSFTEINFQEFSDKSNCIISKTNLEELFDGAIGTLKMKCVKK